MPVTLPFAEIMSHNMQMGNKSFFADFLTEKANCPESITDFKQMLLRSSMANYFFGFGGFLSCHVDFVLKGRTGS